MKNRIRVGLGVLVTLAALLVLPAAWKGFLLQQRTTVGLGIILMIVSGGLWWYMERRIFTPLEDMTGVVAAMSEGHLDQTLEAGNGTELAQLAELINTFSVNQQEGLLFAWNQAGSGLQCLQTIARSVQRTQNAEADSKVILEEIRRTREHLEGIRDLVRTYYLYDVSLEDEKALAAEDADSLSACQPPTGSHSVVQYSAELHAMKGGSS